MKVLMLTPYLPYPPTSGGQVRSFNLIKNLAKDHQITLFSLIKNEQEGKYVENLKKYCKKVAVFNRPAKPWTLKNIFKTGFGTYPFLVIRNFSSEEARLVAKELEEGNYDLIHAENFYVMPHIPKTDIPILLTEQTILYSVFQHFVESLPWYFCWLKPILMIDVLKLKYWELRYWRSADYLAAVSPEDKARIEKATEKKVFIVPNGVDYQYLSARRYEKLVRPTVFFGNADMHWLQNEEGAKVLLNKVWPLIKKMVPKSKLWIGGKIAPEVLRKYQRLDDVTIEEIGIGEQSKGYQQAWVMVAPMQSGGGSRTKFFEAMASGLPIVTTPEGAEGIPVKNNREMMIRKGCQAIAKASINLLENKELAEQVGRRAKNFVRKKCDWSNSAKLLSKVYKKIGHE